MSVFPADDAPPSATRTFFDPLAMAACCFAILSAICSGLLYQQLEVSRAQAKELANYVMPRVGSRAITPLTGFDNKEARGFRLGGPARIVSLKRTLLIFNQANCGYCQANYNVWSRLGSLAKLRGIQVAVIDRNPVRQNDLLDRLQPESRLLIAEESRLQSSFLIAPVTAIIDGEGYYSVVFLGELREREYLSLAQVIDKI